MEATRATGEPAPRSRAASQPAPRSRAARFNEIVQTLLRHDMWGLLRDLQADPEDASPDAPVRLRRVLEELGPTFVKLGQLLATRPDLVPARYVEEFRLLYDQTAPSPFPEVKAVVESELGRPIEEVFEQFGAQAIASASIGQVHRATLRDGTRVAVKVQHVGVERSMRLDFEILLGLARFMEGTFARTRLWQPVDHLRELQEMLSRELDYRHEMRNTQRVAHNFRNDESVRIPRMHPALCTQKVLVMEYMDGIKMARLAGPVVSGPDGRPVDGRTVARIVTHAMARQIFVHRLFHADPSPGNIIVMASDQVAFLDFGAVGTVTRRRSATVLRMISAISAGDGDATAEAIVDLCDRRTEHDHRRLLTDVERMLDLLERDDVSVADPRLMEMLLGIAKTHGMMLPPDFVLISRALFQFEGFCRELDPGFDLVEVLQPLVAEVVWSVSTGGKGGRQGLEETLMELLRVARGMPHAVGMLMRKVERNDLSARIELAGMEGMKAAQGRAALKLSFSLMAAALVVGLGLVYAGPDPGRTVGPFLFVAGWVVAVWILVMLLWSEALRTNRR